MNTPSMNLSASDQNVKYSLACTQRYIVSNAHVWSVFERSNKKAPKKNVIYSSLYTSLVSHVPTPRTHPNTNMKNKKKKNKKSNENINPGEK